MDVLGRWAKPTIEGSLVTLRPACGDDADAAWEMMHDAEGNDLTATNDVFERDQIVEWYRSRPSQPELLDLAIVERSTGEFAGEVVLNAFDPVANSASFRVSLRGSAWFGRGLGTEATQMMVDHGLHVIGLDHIDLEVLARNPRARRVYEKVGFSAVEAWHEDGEEWIRMRIVAEGATADLA